MKLLDLTLPSPEENLALDEALLDGAEAGESASDLLRLWEMPHAAVIVGRSSRVKDEVHLTAAKQFNVPLLRRTSGGAAIVAGPGCLMYSVVLRYAGREHLRLLDHLHAHILAIVRTALGGLVDGVEFVGTSDLAIGGQKFSGNSVRCKHNHFLYHGTILYALDLTLIARFLKLPPRQPEYRQRRSHEDFIMNLPVKSCALRRAIAHEFAASEPLETWPLQRVRQLVTTRYSQSTWNFER